MFGTVPTSIPQFILFGNWLLEGRFNEKWQRIKTNKIFWILSSVYLLHLLGLLHTTELARGLDDIRIKIPMLLLPLVFFSSAPITKKELHMLFRFFILAVVLSSLWCLFYYYSHELSDVRKASRFMSHIRFGLFINLCIGVLFYLMRAEKKLAITLGGAITIIYLLLVMTLLGMVTGLMLFAILFLLYILYLVLSQGLMYKLIGVFVLLTTFSLCYFVAQSEWDKLNYVDASEKNVAKEKTLSGRPYYRIDTANFHTENGFYIAKNIQYFELTNEWRKRSQLDLYKQDSKGIEPAWNLIRYLTSKGLTKDSAGVVQLSNEDIAYIEKGATNYKYTDVSPLRLRLKDFFWEYKDYKQGFNPSGNTLLMRLEFWKAAVYIIQRNLWVGVGTGDVQRAFEKAYYRTNTKLSHEWRLRSHNQFLAITVAFGLTGLLVFLISIIYPALTLRKKLSGLYWLFLSIALISFLTEDTLETQSGVSFFAYFNTLFLWLANSGKKPDHDQNL